MNQPMTCTVLENRTVAVDTYLLRLKSSDCPQAFVPGQFVHVLVPDRPDLVLRRPLSVHRFDRESGEITLIYQIKGKGTQAFARLDGGDTLSVLGPLGRGFPMDKQWKRCILIGGGIGCAPLLTLPAAFPDTTFDAVLGYRSMAHIYQRIPFEQACRQVIFTTDDGSYGREGTAVEALSELLEQPCDAVYACGPLPMLKSLQAAIKPSGTPCFASLEERMGCGVGACVTCTCTVIDDGRQTRKRVCKDGPVFSLAEVVL